MADKWYTAASGNWSTAANWNGGTLPQAGDDVYADGKAVTIDQTVNVGTIRTTQRTGGTVGGTFTISSAQSITCTSSTGILGGTNGGAVLITATSGTITIVANQNGGNTSGASAITISGTGCTVNVTGNQNGGSNANTAGILITGASTLNVTGNQTAGSNGSAYGINSTTNPATINVTGNQTASSAAGINMTTGTNLTINGITTASSTAVGVASTSLSATTIFSGIAYNSTLKMAFDIGGGIFKISNANTTQWVFYSDTNVQKSMYTAGVALGNPATNNVRSGTVYGASNELTGTLIVPLPSNVVSGVPTDNTVGTYSTTPALIATEIFTKLFSGSDFSTSGSFGKLVKDNLDAKSSDIKAKTDLIPTNPASVQSVGAIVASYNV